MNLREKYTRSSNNYVIFETCRYDINNFFLVAFLLSKDGTLSDSKSLNFGVQTLIHMLLVVFSDWNVLESTLMTWIMYTVISAFALRHETH